MEKIDQFMAGVDNIVRAIGGLILIYMTVNVIVVVLVRVTLGLTAEWTEEITRYAHITNVCLMMGSLIYSEGHITMDLILRKLKGRVRVVVGLFNALVTFGFCFMGFYWGVQWVGKLYAYGGKTSSQFFYTWMPALGVPIGFCIASIFGLYMILKKISHIRNPEEETEPAMPATTS